MKIFKLFLTSAIVSSLALTSASAETISFSDGIEIRTTNYDDIISIEQFDPSLGTLNSVEVVLTGMVEGDANAESLDASSSDVTLELAAEVVLTRPGANFDGVSDSSDIPDDLSIAVALPIVTSTETLSAFDGDIDFAGTSGVSFTGLSNSNTVTEILTSMSDLALFTGTGILDLGVAGLGISNASGSGNLITQFNTSAGANVVITYDFDAFDNTGIDGDGDELEDTEVPEPATMILLGLGLVGLAAAKKRSA